MSALQLWLQNHNRKRTQDAIDEALMEYITHIEMQRDELLSALGYAASCLGTDGNDPIDAVIASVKEKRNGSRD